MKTLTFKKGWATGAAAAVAFSLAATLSGHAAVVTWGAATNITGISNVSTAGSLVGAFNVGDTGVASTIVNGVNFQSFAVPNASAGATVGNFAIAAGTPFFSDNLIFGSPTPPFSSLPAAYQTLLQAGIANQPNFTLTMSALTVGAQYQFQWWVNNSTLGGDLHTATAGNTVTLSDNTSGLDGGLGQFAVGTFTANATSQQITFSGPIFAQLNGFQLRNVTPVPESASLLFGLGLIPLIAFVELRRKNRGTVAVTV